MKSLRTKELEAKYQKDLKEGKNKSLWDEPPIFDNGLYKIINNNYKYDRMTDDEHVMLITKEDPNQAFVWARDWAEVNDYSMVCWNTPKKQTVPDIIHIHILK